MYRFKLSPSFVEGYKNKLVLWSPLGEFVFYRTYSRLIEGENRNEKWWESDLRVVEGTYQVQKAHCDELKLPWNNAKAQHSAGIMFDKIFNFKFMPPGRGMWMMGSDFVKTRGGAALNNCGFISTDDIEIRGSFAFCWCMDMLMLGVGVGFDVKGAGKLVIQRPRDEGSIVYKIPDSREGWVKSVEYVLNAFFSGRELPVFDYSLVRPYGTPIKGFGGVASGPEPLQILHASIMALLSKREGQELSSVDIVDLFNFIGVCVVAGNVRRSAECALGEMWDSKYRLMKDPRTNLQELKSHRWASNNSIFAQVGKTDYYLLKDTIAQNGEPGIVWLENVQKYSRFCDPPDMKDMKVKGVNPCFEQALESAELCNLDETYPSHHANYQEYQETLKYAYLYAKTVTLISTHWPETNAILLRNRRIGLSQSGIIDAFNRHGRSNMLQWCRDGYDYLKRLDQIYSDWLCIPLSLKRTSVKPSGTVSLVAGVSPGIHYPHSEYYIRRVSAPKDSPLIEAVKKAGYDLEEKNNDNKTMIVSFPMHEKYFDRCKRDVSIWEQMANVAAYQKYWADNNVSVTVHFKKEEIDEIPRVLAAYEDQIKAVSFLPLDEHGYEQAPYEEITQEVYETMVGRVKPIDYSGIRESPMGEKYCDTLSCESK